MMRRTSLLDLLVLASSGARAEDRAAIDQVWLARMKTEGKAAYQRYQALASRIEETSESRADIAAGCTRRSPAYSPHSNRERSFRLDENCIKEQIRIYDNSPERPLIHLHCDNRDYFFTLSKAQEAAEFALTEYGPGARKYPLLSCSQGLHALVYAHLGSALSAVENDAHVAVLAVRREEKTAQSRVCE